MEEILASIRRIIADDNNAPAAQAAQKPAPELGPVEADNVIGTRDGALPEADVLELTQPVEPGPAAAFKPVRGPDVVFREEDRAEADAAPAPSPAPVPTPRRVPARENLLSPSSASTVSAAFENLAGSVLEEHSRTLEDIVKEMLRPMLKQWLEENLPGLVERLVRAEIERVSRGAR
jgi:cell pole-organizing protein PopZ